MQSNQVYTISGRWTKKLVEHGFTPISDVFLVNYIEMGITNPEAVLLIHLLSFKWDERHPFPSFAVLAKRMGVSATSARNHARSLQKKGFLRRIQRQGETNEFDLQPLFNALEKYATIREKALGGSKRMESGSGETL